MTSSTEQKLLEEVKVLRGLLITAEDKLRAITNCRLSEPEWPHDSLRNSEALYLSVLEASPDCLKVIDTSGNIEYMNAKGCELMEIDDFALVAGSDWSSLWSAGNKQKVIDAIAAANCGKESHFESYGTTAKGSFKWWDVFVRPILDLQGKTIRIFATSRDITERKLTSAHLLESRARLAHAADAAGLTYVAVDIERGVLQTPENFAAVMGYAALREEAIEGARGPQQLIDHVVAPDRLRVATALHKFLSGSEASGKIDYRVIGDDNIERCIETVWSVEYDADGKTRRAFATNLAITERKRSEEKAQLLMGEVNHRAKNLLAVVQAIAQQTAKHDEPATFVERLSERINGLAASHDLLVRNHWQAVELGDLVISQLAHFLDLIGTRVHLDGPSARLTPPAAQGIGMALHELATNAGKYGAISNDVGQVRICWQIATAGTPRLLISWLEEGGPDVVPPKHKGFGQKVIGNMVAAAVDGHATIAYLKNGVSWTLTAPVAGVLEQGWAAPPTAYARS